MILSDICNTEKYWKLHRQDSCDLRWYLSYSFVRSSSNSWLGATLFLGISCDSWKRSKGSNLFHAIISSLVSKSSVFIFDLTGTTKKLKHFSSVGGMGPIVQPLLKSMSCLHTSCKSLFDKLCATNEMKLTFYFLNYNDHALNPKTVQSNSNNTANFHLLTQ